MRTLGPRSPIFALSLFGLLLSFSTAHAQEPADDADWTARCTQLNASSKLIDTGSAPPALVQTTQGIPGATFASMARERSAAGQHYVACALYYTAAIAERLGNGGKVDINTSHTDVAVAATELKLAIGQKLGFTDKLNRASDKMIGMAAPSLTPQAIASVITAFGGTPMQPAVAGMPGALPGAAPAGSDPALAGVGSVPSTPLGTDPALGGGGMGGGGPVGVDPALAGGVPQPATATGTPLGNDPALAGAALQGGPAGTPLGADPALSGVTAPANAAAAPPVSGSSAAHRSRTARTRSASALSASAQPASLQVTALAQNPAGVNCSNADENYARLCQVQQHPSKSGVPAACQTNWAKSGPLSQQCANALWQQGESERNAGDCAAAMADYDNAKQAAQNAGSIVMEGLRQEDARTACTNNLHPPKPDPRYGKAGVMPVGRYTCYSAPAVIANGGAYGVTKVQVGQFQGYAYIFDDHRYAGNGDGKDTGSYHMQGNKMIANDGPYKRNNIAAAYEPHGVYGRPTLFLSFLDDNNKPIVSLGCTHDGPPAGR